jgi:serine/threonine protein kinase/Tol biopolymer transport system component
MSSDRWEQIEDVFHSARDLNHEDRPRFLDERCGCDGRMRQQLEALLAQDEDLTSFLDGPSLDAERDRQTGRLTGWSGIRLGAYEVHEAIGAGEMGEVYRARDTKLGRDVALKTLPQRLALDSDRLARFEREAQVLAALNHPNIAAIYGFEELIAGGSGQQAVVRALVLEFVEGVTLADRIAQGSLPVDEAISIARQIAEALAAAHQRAIIHRDLKPANVKLRSDGTVKVLDFGLAKVLEPVGTTAEVMPLWPNNPAITQVGVILGTAAYMSPEQATGHATDKRSDVWAFGCLLFEMLTATRAFAGEGVHETLSAVLSAEPDWTRLPVTVPSSIRTLLEGCLRKDRNECLADISAARFLLAEGQTHPLPLSSARSDSLWRRAGPLAMTAAIAAMIGALVAWMARPSAPVDSTNLRASRFTVAAPRGTSFGTREQTISPAISPDGARVVFRVLRHGEPVLAVRAIDGLDAQVLAGTEGATFPFWSPDGRTIAFFADEQLRTIGAGGGPIRTICATASRPSGGSWNRENLIIFATSSSEGLFKVSATGGQPSPLTTLQSGESSHRFPQFFPDGHRFVYFAAPDSWYLASTEGGSPVRVLTNEFGVRYAASGYLLFERGSALLVQRFDADRSRLVGEPVEIGEGVMALPGSGEAPFSVSENGVLAYAFNPQVDVRLEWVDRAGRFVKSLGAFPFGRYANPVVSPDGSKIAMESVPASRTEAAPWSNQDVWIVDADHGRSTQLTFDPASDEHPVWSPDASRVVYSSRRPAAPGLYEKVASNEKPEELLLQGDGLYAWDWSTEGIVYDSGGQSPDLWFLPLAGARTPYALVRARLAQTAAQLSPDRHWLAYQSDELGRPEIFVKGFPPTDTQWRVSTGGGLQPRWRRDGKELFYLAADGKLMTTAVRSNGGIFRAEVAQPLFQTDLMNLYPRLRRYGVSSDGQRFLISNSEDPGATASIVVATNWNVQSAR